MQYLRELEKWLSDHLPEVVTDLNPGATEETLASFASVVGTELPADFYALYRWHDGQKMEINTGPWYGLSFLTLDGVMRELKSWKDVLADFTVEDLNSLDNDMSSTPTGYVKRQYGNLLWIPFAYDFGGNYLGIDLDPDEKGCVGQVINFGRDEARKIAIAPSLEAFLAWMMQEIKSGNVNIQEEEDGGRSFNTLRPEKYHFLDSLATMF